jgi:hypothetical protein
MIMPEVLKARPVNVQVKHRAGFAPPRYDLFNTEVSASLAMKLAERFNLKSTGIIVNQNASSTNYISFRYFLPGEPVRFFDVSIGIDQAEIIFSNPATVLELMQEVEIIWSLIFESLTPSLNDNYFEAAVHCETDGASAKAFLDKAITVKPNAPGMHKGFSVTNRTSETVSKLSLDVSESVPDGLYVAFAYVSRGIVTEMASLVKLVNLALASYRSLQTIAQIELMEPS